ncbi:unnamed protein product, partial [Mesorhabditis belari]|uniref:Receptor expression-enhancing protein n=1 Tax=Mesorhabditis belari TaxID=2138241 RepID=A0AAF3EGG5_9BILA
MGPKIDLAKLRMVFSFLCKVGSIIVGTLFPCFNTYKAAKRRDGPVQKFYTKYWTIFACVSSIEAIADLFYITSLVPGYELAFLLWTSTGGAHFVYDKVVYPFLKKHEKQIDEAMSSTGRLAFRAAGSLFTTMTTALTSMAAKGSTSSVSTSIIGNPVAQLVSQVPTHMHRQVIRSLSVEGTFEQPQAVYSARVVEVEELDDEDWEEYIPKEKHEETRRSFVSRRPQKAPETKTTPLRRSKRHQEKHRASIASKGSGDEDEANSSDQVFNLGSDELATDDEGASRGKIKSKRGGLGRRGRGRNATMTYRGNDST